MFKPMPIDQIPIEEIKILGEAVMRLQPGNRLVSIVIDGVSPMVGQDHAQVETFQGSVSLKWDHKAGLQRKLAEKRAQRDKLAKECIKLSEELDGAG